MAIVEKSDNLDDTHDNSEEEPINPDLVIESDNLTPDVGLTDEELDKLEVVDEDEEPVNPELTEESDNLDTAAAADGGDNSDNLLEAEVITPNKSVLQQINDDRHLQKQLQAIGFLKEYSKNPHRSIENVANKLQLTSATCRKYLNEYVDKVKDSIKNEKYPDQVLNFYNSDNKISEEKKLKFYHMDKLKDIVLRYSNFNIDLNTGNKSLNKMDAQGLNSKHSVSENDNISLLGTTPISDNSSPPAAQQPMKSSYDTIDELDYGITTFQLIRFGLYNIFGQKAAQVITRMLGPNPDEYLSSELKMKNLLMMTNITELKADRFIEWLKANAKYVAHPSGFLSYNQPPPPQQPQQQQQPNYYGGTSNNNGNGMDMNDPIINNYYQSGIYIPGVPPSHPMNIQRLKEHSEKQREDEQMKQMDKRMNIIMRTKLLDVMDTSNKPQSNGMFSPEIMVAMGLAEMVPITDQEGNTQMKLIPRGAQNSQQQNPQQSQTEQMTSMMSMMKEMMSFMSTMNRQQQGPNSQTDIMQMIMPQLVNKMMENPNNRMQEMVQMYEVMNKLKGDMNGGGNMMGGQQLPPEVILAQERMRLDKDFAMQQFDLKREQLRIERDRLDKQDAEASNNVDKLMEGINQVAPMVMGIVQQFLMGNKGGAPGGAPGQPGIPGQPNPAELLLKMEYEKQRREKADEMERRKREYEEEIARKNAYAANPYMNPQAVPSTVYQPEAEHVTVTTREEQKVVRQEPDVYTEQDFIRYTPEELENAKQEALREKRRLESYVNSLSSVLENKRMNGEQYVDEPFEEEVATEYVEPPQKVTTTTTIVKKQEQPDMSAILDASSRVYDPDYDGSTEAVEIDDKTGETEEEVDI